MTNLYPTVDKYECVRKLYLHYVLLFTITFIFFHGIVWIKTDRISKSLENLTCEVFKTSHSTVSTSILFSGIKFEMAYC